MLSVEVTIKFPGLSELSVSFHASITPHSSTCLSTNFVTTSLILRIFPLTAYIAVHTYFLYFIFLPVFYFYLCCFSFFSSYGVLLFVIHIFYLYSCIRNIVFTCVIVKGGKRAIFGKILQCLAYNRMSDDSIYEEMHLRASTHLGNDI